MLKILYVFILSNNTVYFFTEIEVLEDDNAFPKDQYVFQKLAFNGLELYNKPLNIELVSTIHTDSFSFNRNNYIQFIINGYNKIESINLK